MLAFGPAGGAAPFLWKLISLIAVVVLILVWALWTLFPPRTAKLALTAFAVIGVTMGLTLVGSEFLVRALFADVTTTADNTSYFASRWYRAHPQSLNDFGFRERNFDRQKPPGTFRIAVVGDSFAYGQGISRAERFSDLMQVELSRGENAVEVLNFGKPGSETVDHIEILNSQVLGTDPDFVLLQWFINDPQGHNKSDMPASYPLIPSKTASRWLHRNSGLYYVANSAWGRIQVAFGWTGSYEDYMRERFQDAHSEDSRRSQAELSTFIKLARANQLNVGIVVFPTLSHEQPFAFLIEQVLQVCEQQSVPCLDLRSEFSNYTPIAALHVNRLDAHPSAIAHRIAATAILHHFSSYWPESPARSDQPN